MIYIDLPADLNLEDDQGRNVARLGGAIAPDAVTPGAVLGGRSRRLSVLSYMRPEVLGGSPPRWPHSTQLYVRQRR